METVEIIALSALALSILLLLKVFSLQRQLNEIKSDLQGPNIGPNVYGSSKPNHNLPPSSNLDERLRLLLDSGKRIQAIKEFKKASGLGLKEAKEYVDRLERGQY
ncbi:ribosomal protein L7/L12 [Paenibacillus sp. FSL H8-0034]|uniref:ribosomal protein L7/L12 n=1 Tax=Paenibacillus sp. FSL H8-0034 TaxID=2954671 RepID=UPI0030F50F94